MVGARGKGATKSPAPKQPNAGGRPRNTIPKVAYDALRGPGLRAIATLDELQLSPKERTTKGLPALTPEDRTRLLAAKAVAELWLKPCEPEQDSSERVVRVVYAKNYEASTG